MMTASLAFDDATIPADLKVLLHWVCWRAVQNGDRIDKVPICAATGRNASSTDSETWTDYVTAGSAANTQGLGIGFVFAQNSGIVGVDLDKCRDADTGVLEPWAGDIVRGLNSYTEVSPSGKGLHVFVRGSLPTGKRKKGRVETYEHGRFFTVTGQHLAGTPTTIEERTVELTAFHARYLADPQPTTRPTPATGVPRCALSEEDILTNCRTAKNAAKFEALWRGDIGGYPSHSEADLALVSILSFYTQDEAQLDRLYRQSGLQREKWTERHGEKTYGEMTIGKALANVRETHTPPQRTGQVGTALNTVEEEESREEEEENSVPVDGLGSFPEDAWRGLFATYRDAMRGTSEAPDTAHFSALWAMAAACLRRRVFFYYAFTHFPNVYLVNYGNTGDSKTSAGRQGLRLLPAEGVKLLRGVGSAEALGDWMQQPEDGPKVSHLLFIEELATLLTRGGWEGSTLLSFLTETFDAPERYEIPFRKNPVLVVEPTPTMIAGTTVEWLWKGLREIDIHGGFGNRLFFLTGAPKPPIPLPAKPNPETLAEVRGQLQRLTDHLSTEFFFMPDAEAIWKEFYCAWKSTQWSDLTTAAIKRVPAYIVKLSMVYACLEGTSLITADQLRAAILVGHYGAKCADRLMNRHRQHGTQAKCEARVLAVLNAGDFPPWKIHRRISGNYTAEELGRAIRALEAAGAIIGIGKTQRGEPVYRRRGRTRQV